MVALPLCQKLEGIPKPISGYPQSPQTIGEHLWWRRTELGQRQKDVAKQIGVSQFTIINWESGETTPAVRFGPKVVEFLGYDPLPDPKSFGQRVWKLRWSLGLTQTALAGQLGIDDVTVRGWETGRHGASEKVRGRLKDMQRNPPGGTLRLQALGRSPG
jgi:DNA-binding XRE family transcriptional regulator